MKKVTDKDVEHIASLSRIRLDGAEKEMMAKHLESVLAHFEMLDKLDTASVPPAAHILSDVNVLRDDAAEEPMARERLLKNAPESDGEAYIVPRVIE